MRRPFESPIALLQTMRRASSAALLVAIAALVAVGCGSGGGDGPDIETIEGPLAWLPSETWLVASVDLGAERIDTAVETLDRLPIWSLAEGFLPASDGTGLRRELLRELAGTFETDGGAGPKASDLEQAFGDRGGFAILEADFEALDSDAPPIAGWFEVDDEDTAVDVVKALAEGAERKREHDGTTYYETTAKDGDTVGAFLVEDGLLVIASTAKSLERLIDVKADEDRSLLADDDGAAVIASAFDDSVTASAIQTGPLLDAVPELLEQAAATGSDPKSREVARKVGAALDGEAIDGLVANWMSTSITIDDVGVRMRGAWSNPRELADPDDSARSIVERMPVDSTIVQGSVTDGTELQRIQRAWKESDVDLRELVAECPAADRWACDVGVEIATAVLEDDGLADALEDAGPAAVVMAQDIAPLIGMVAQSSVPGTRPAGALDAPVFEYATTEQELDWSAPDSLTRALRSAGLVVDGGGEDAGLVVKLLPDSPIDREFTKLDAPSLATLQLLGVDLAKLRSSAGQRFASKDVDGLEVFTLPFDAPSNVVPALEGDDEQLADSETYETVVEAAIPPDRTGAYGYVDILGYVDGTLEALRAAEPQVSRAAPTVRNNLADMPGLVYWSAREEVDGEEVGTFQVVLPILE